MNDPTHGLYLPCLLPFPFFFLFAGSEKGAINQCGLHVTFRQEIVCSAGNHSSLTVYSMYRVVGGGSNGALPQCPPHEIDEIDEIINEMNGSMKTSLFSKHAELRFASVVLDGVLGYLCLAHHTPRAVLVSM